MSFIHFSESETGAVRKSHNGLITAALVYPNTYRVGMSNLGVHAVYDIFNRMEDIVCERVFLHSGAEKPKTVESGCTLTNFDIIAFSIAFENDYPAILQILEGAELPFRSEDRNHKHPILIAGGTACRLNPEPIAAFIDAFLIGEAEEILPNFINFFVESAFNSDRKNFLLDIARNVPGVYVPQFYNPNLGGIPEPICDVPPKIKHMTSKDISGFYTCSSVLTPDTIFGNAFLVEVSRGCPHRCRFCSAGYISSPPRFRTAESIASCILEKGMNTGRVGLVGAAVSDLPGISDLCRELHERNIRISFSSLRADALSEPHSPLMDALKNSGIKTATIAPEAGSERMRKVINKGLTETDILNAAENLVSTGIPNLKLYFMVGLPTETDDDIKAIVELCSKIKQRFLSSSRKKGHIGYITISLNPFVPKPFTPFQHLAMIDKKTLKKRIDIINRGIKRIPNIRLHAENPRQTYIQAILSRADRSAADILIRFHQNNGNWAKTLKGLISFDDMLKQRDKTNLFPWEIIDHRIDRDFLDREYERAKGVKC